jgi:large subunit ribosomal protein L5
MQPRLHDKYKSEVVGKLIADFSLTNKMSVPKLTKIVINTSMKEAIQNSKLLDAVAEEITLIAGQRAVITKARKSVSNFKLREGMPLGAKVTLRRQQMWEFLDRFITVASPRIRDFRGLNPNGFDGRGNYSLGLTEQIIFPEVVYDKIKKVNGTNIKHVTTANTDHEAYSLLKTLGLPLQDK